MTKLIIYGASDDLIETEGAIDEEFYADSHGRWEGTLIADDRQGVRITAAYLNVGTWAIGVAPLDEGYPIPDWDFRIVNASDNDYTAALEVDVPEDVKLTQVVQSA